MRKLLWFIVAIGLGKSIEAQPSAFPVIHQHFLRDCRGTLHFSEEGIVFETTRSEDARRWNYVDVAQLKVEAGLVEIVSYEDQRRMLGRDRIFRFRLLEGTIAPELALELSRKVVAPVSAVLPPEPDRLPVFELPVKHRHTWGGCNGLLVVTSQGILFESSDQPRHSRFWSYSDLQQLGQTAPLQIEILTYERQWGGPHRAFQFQLKAGLPAGLYDYVWVRIHPSALDSRFQTRRVEGVRGS